MKLHAGTWLCEDGAVVALAPSSGRSPWSGYIVGADVMRYFSADGGIAMGMPAGYSLVSPVVIADEDPDMYQQAALSTVREGVDVELMCAVGLAGEVGEVCEPIKKHRFHGKGLDKAHMKKEIGDVLWYLAVLADHYGFKLSSIMKENREKLAARYATLKMQREIDARAEAWVQDRLMSDRKGDDCTRPETPDAAVSAAEDGSTGRTVPVDRPLTTPATMAAPSTPSQASPGLSGGGLTGMDTARQDTANDGTGDQAP